MKSTQSASVTIKHDTTVGELISWLGKRPTNGKVSISVTPGDRPFDSGTESLSVRWEEED